MHTKSLSFIKESFETLTHCLQNNKIYIFFDNDQDPEPGQFCSIEPLLAIFLILQQKDLFFIEGFNQGQQIPFLQFAAVSCIVLPRKMLDISVWVVVPLYLLPNALGQGYNGKIYFFVHYNRYVFNLNTGVATDQPKTQSGSTWVYGKTDYPQWLISRGLLLHYITFLAQHNFDSSMTA